MSGGGRREHAGRKQQWFKLSEENAYSLAQLVALRNRDKRPGQRVETGEQIIEDLITAGLAQAWKCAEQQINQCT